MVLISTDSTTTGASVEVRIAGAEVCWLIDKAAALRAYHQYAKDAMAKETLMWSEVVYW